MGTRMQFLRKCKDCSKSENCFYKESLPVEVEIYGCGIDGEGKECVLIPIPKVKGVD